MSTDPLSLSYFLEGIKRKDRVALSRAITLVESSREQDQSLAADLLDAVSRLDRSSFRIAVTGVPGAGKSTLIEAVGLQYIAQGRNVAVLAIDPTSHISGGSILGDKTRMPQLSASERAFIRPSPTRGSLGGLSFATPEAMLLCEAAGYELILVETVGVGQAEIDASDIADMVLLVLIAGAGDDLQGLKRGILEIADIIAINKADGPNEAAAHSARTVLRSVVKLLPGSRPDWTRSVVATSATSDDGLDDLLPVMKRFERQLRDSGQLELTRRLQRERRFERLVMEVIRQTAGTHPVLEPLIRDAAERVESRSVTPVAAARQVAKSLTAILDSVR